jgi:hypothetical protein
MNLRKCGTIMANIQLVNRVFNLLARDTKGSVPEDEWGEIINATLDAKLNVILGANTWSFAIGFAELARNTSTEHPGYLYQYPFPLSSSGILNVYQPFDQDGRVRIGSPLMSNSYIISNKLIFTNIERVLVKYKSTDIVAAEQEQAFIEALAYLAASELAITLLENNNLAQQYIGLYIEYRKLARKNDVQPGLTRGYPTEMRFY